MNDYNEIVVSALETVLPTHYEMALTSQTKTPCISYMVTNNTQITDGLDNATLAYSRVSYQIKVWGNVLKDLARYAAEVDAVMRPLGFKRTSSGELYDNSSTMIQKILNYEALAQEAI